MTFPRGLLRSVGAPWSKVDKEFFEQHPDQTYYVREADRFEMDGTDLVAPPIVFQAFRRKVMEEGGELRMMVVQVRPGFRTRAPVVWRDGEVLAYPTVRPDGTLGERVPVEEAARLYREAADSLAAEADAQSGPNDQEVCAVCQCDLPSFALCYVVEFGPSAPPLPVCKACRVRLPDGAVIRGVTIFMSDKARLDNPRMKKRFAKTVRELKRLQADGVLGRRYD